MATNLTEAAYYSRKGLKIGGIFIAAVLLLRSSIVLTTNIIELLQPEPKVLPNYQYGRQLQPISFPTQPETNSLAFSLETIDGKLPFFGEIATVHFIPLGKYGFQTLNEAQVKASAYGFNNQPKQLPNTSETIYQWRTGAEIGASFTMKVINQTFEYRYEYEKDQALLNSTLVLDEGEAKKAADLALKKGGFLNLDLSEGTRTTTFYRYDPTGLEKVYTVLDADFIRVNYQRADINEIPVLSPYSEKTNVSVLIGKKEGEREDISFVEISYNYFPVNETSQATYPLKQTTQAWSELKEGRAFISSLGKNESGQIKIRQIYLAYFDPNIPQNYLQPIYVFEGDNGFLAFVPALANEVYSGVATETQS